MEGKFETYYDDFRLEYVLPENIRKVIDYVNNRIKELKGELYG